jgi:DNA-binding transcriptional MerR regulator
VDRLHQIKVVSRLTGLPPDTIRIWERRYGVVEPHRDDRGMRLYRDQDIDRLNLLRRAVDAGHSIGRLARLTDEALADLLVSVAPVLDVGSRSPERRLQRALEAFDTRAIDTILTEVVSFFTPRALVDEVAIPIIQWVGDTWEQDDLGIAREHLATAALRTLLGNMVRLRDPWAHLAPVVFATLENERHELGLLLAALVAAGRGIPVCYLGADLPAQQIAGVARKLEADGVALSIVYVPDVPTTVRELHEVLDELDGMCPVWVGGQGARRVVQDVNRSSLMRVDDLEAFERALSGIRPRAA